MAFSPRMTADGIYENEKWYSTGNIYYPNYRLPNCTCYAYGRFWEILGTNPNLASGNGEDWWHNINNYPKGQTPQLGAIACWDGGVGYDGHVAIVEQITADGIVTSNSGYYRPISSYPPDTPSYFWTETCYFTNGTRSSWQASRNYVFQGYIYNPGATPLEWITGNRYLTDEEMTNNAYMFFYAMSGYGWTLSAIAGALGNIQSESGINPGIWQNLYEHPENGYGLVQWTPSTNYTNWATENGYAIDDGEGQCYWIANETVAQGQWIPTDLYPISFANYTSSEDSPEWCASAFLRNFERPASFDTETTRQQQARAWYNLLQNAPGPIRPNKPVPGWGADVWIQYGAIAETLRRRKIIL